MPRAHRTRAPAGAHPAGILWTTPQAWSANRAGWSSEVTGALEQLGGIAARKPLLAMVSRRELEDAVAAGVVVRARRGVYALPTDDRPQQAARAHTAVAVLVTAAAHWQWPRKWEPRKPQLAIPRGRGVAAQVGGLVLRFTWTQVMTKADWVRARISATVRRRQAQVCPACRAAS